jgi:hypothetical protein
MSCARQFHKEDSLISGTCSIFAGQLRFTYYEIIFAILLGATDVGCGHRYYAFFL